MVLIPGDRCEAPAGPLGLAHRDMLPHDSSKNRHLKERIRPLGVDEDAELIIVILLVMGLLPFALVWLERTMDKPSKPRRRRG